MTGPDDRRLLDSLAHAERLVGQAQSVAFALEAIGIELPPGSASTADAGQLRAIASLYFAAELDAAGIVAAAESLAGLHGAGSSTATMLGSAAAEVAHFWEGRHTRATAAERQALFARLFGADTGIAAADHPGNDAFQTDMIELTEALYKLDEAADNRQWGGIAQQMRVRTVAARLIDGLTAAAGGLTVFMAQDLLATLKQALTIFRHADLRLALHAHDMWGAVAGALRLARQPATQTALHATRAGAGMTVLTWLADAAPHLGGEQGPLVALDHPVIPAAIEWLEVSLKIGEGAATADAPAAPAAAPASAAAPSVSPWAAFAG